MIEDIIKSNEKMIYKLTNRFYGVDKEDLFQAGVLGLLKALKNYKESDAKFSTYAFDYIYGEMYNLALNKTIKINKEILKLYKSIEKTRAILSQKMDRIPSNEDIAKFLNMDIKDINNAVMSGFSIMSLDNEREMPYYETIRLDEKNNIDDAILISESLETLTDDEQNIIKARYYEDLTQSEVAKKLCMSQVMVSRYEKKGLTKMQAFMQL